MERSRLRRLMGMRYATLNPILDEHSITTHDIVYAYLMLIFQKLHFDTIRSLGNVSGKRNNLEDTI